MSDDTLLLIRESALRLLARREHSRKEMIYKMILRDFPTVEAEQVLDELESENLLSDRRFTETFVRQRFERGSGPVKIRAELFERGISDNLANRYLADEEYDWFASICRVREKRFGMQRPTTFEMRVKQSRFLSGRGFTAEHIKYALDS